jgi:hypothetical protein
MKVTRLSHQARDINRAGTLSRRLRVARAWESKATIKEECIKTRYIKVNSKINQVQEGGSWDETFEHEDKYDEEQ